MNAIKDRNLEDLCRSCLKSINKRLSTRTNENNLLVQDSDLPKLFLNCTSVDVTKDLEGFPKRLCKLCLEKVVEYDAFRKLTLKSTEALFQKLKKKDDNAVIVENSEQLVDREDNAIKIKKKPAIQNMVADHKVKGTKKIIAKKETSNDDLDSDDLNKPAIQKIANHKVKDNKSTKKIIAKKGTSNDDLNKSAIQKIADHKVKGTKKIIAKKDTSNDNLDNDDLDNDDLKNDDMDKDDLDSDDLNKPAIQKIADHKVKDNKGTKKIIGKKGTSNDDLNKSDIQKIVADHKVKGTKKIIAKKDTSNDDLDNDDMDNDDMDNDDLDSDDLNNDDMDKDDLNNDDMDKDEDKLLPPELDNLSLSIKTEPQFDVIDCAEFMATSFAEGSAIDENLLYGGNVTGGHQLDASMSFSDDGDNAALSSTVNTAVESPDLTEPNQCMECLKTFKSHAGLYAHRRKFHPETIPKKVIISNLNSKGEISCQLCGRTCISKHSLGKHMKRHHQVRKFVCQECGVAKVTRTELETHMRIHMTDKEMFPCPQCPQVFSHKNAISRHIRVVHEGEQKFECSICGKKVATRNSLARHELVHAYPHPCTICNRGFAQEKSLRAHMKNNHRVKNATKYVCLCCSQEFLTIKILQEHERRHLVKAHMCDICGKGLANDLDLEVHKRTQHDGDNSKANTTDKSMDSDANMGDKKTFQCTECSKSYKSIARLSAHRKSYHPEEYAKDGDSYLKNELSCEICGRICISRSALRKHKNRHHKERKHVCQECGSAKVTRAELEVHMRVHMPNREKFSCPQCHKLFNQQHTVYRHIKVVHEGEQNFECSFCGKKFATRSSVKSHELLHTRKAGDIVNQSLTY